MNLRIGQGIDVHRFAQGRDLIIGGIKIPYELGLEGHSDADVLLHALTDAILGAAGEGDIGTWFPDTDSQWKGASSIMLLERVWANLKEKGWRVINVDSTIIAQAPKLAPYISSMKEIIARVLEIEASACGIKATTSERLGYEGRKEGITAHAIALLCRET